MITISQPPDNIRAWRRAVTTDRRLPQSARRFGEWLSHRKVRGTDEYSGCQDSAAIDLGIAVSSVRRAMNALLAAGYVERTTRGTRYQRCARFRLLEVDQSTAQNGRLTRAEKLISQPPLGWRLKPAGQPLKMSASMNTAPPREQRDHDAASETQRAAPDPAEMNGRRVGVAVARAAGDPPRA
jgi:hypothetical protein